MSQTVTFDIWAWRDIMRVCGEAVSYDETRIMLQYVQIRCDNNHFTATGTNGCLVATLEGECVMSEKDLPFTVLIPPRKAPAKTKAVELHANTQEDKYMITHTLYFRDKDGNLIDTCTEDIHFGDYVDIDFIVKMAQKNINDINYGEGQYMIAVNPKYLLAALGGMKECSSVIINFASPVQPFLIRPYDNDHEQDRSAWVYPVRIR